MNRTIEIKKIAIRFLVYCFFCHGLLYFYYSENYYSYTSPIKPIKYIVILFGVLMLSKVNARRLAVLIIVIPFLMINHYMACGITNDILIMNYFIPLLTVFLLYDVLYIYIDSGRLVRFAYVLTSVVTYVECFLIMGPFFTYADQGYRAGSIFMHPNVNASMIVLMTMYILMNDFRTTTMFASIINTGVVLTLTGSRAGVLLFFIGTGMLLIRYVWRLVQRDFRIKRSHIPSVFLAGLGGGMIILYGFSGLQGYRRLTNLSLKEDGRLLQIKKFFLRDDFSFIFPNEYSNVYIDNLYLHIWGFFGVAIMLIYLGWNIYILNKSWRQDKRLFVVFFIFCVYGFFENWLYFFPIAYVYWYLCAKLMYCSNKT